MAVSKDGGNSFQNFKISESPFAPWSSVFFGDYTNVSAFNNVVRPIWTRLDQNGLSIWTAIIDTDVVGLNEEESIPFALEQNYPNPFSESTWFKFKIRKAGVSSLIVYDVFGNKIVSVFEDKFFRPGKYVEHFKPAAYALKPGCFYFRFCSANECSQRKMLYVK